MFFLFIMLLIIFLVIAIHTSKIGIEIENLQLDTQRTKKLNEECKIYVYLIILKKIKLFKKDTRNAKFINKGLDVKLLKNKDLKIDYKDLIKNTKLEIEKFNLNLQIGTENAALTAMLVGVISTFIGIVIRKPKYQIIPIYVNKNFLKINFEGIFTINLMHYVYNEIFKKKRDKKDNKATIKVNKNSTFSI